MTKEEFKSLPKETKLVQIIYDYEKRTVHIKYFSRYYYKNFGNSSRDIINKYNNHYIARTCSGAPVMWCTEDRLDITLENFKNFLVKHEKEIIEKSLANIETIENSKIMIDTSLLN